MAPQGRFTRDLTNDINYRVRGAISWDVRQQTEYGTLRTYIRFGAENTTPAATGGGTTFNPFWDRAFIQFAGFTVGRSQSFFDLFTYGGAYSYHNVRVSGDTGASGQNLWAYTAQFGNGFSGTLSLEDPATRKGGGTVDVTAAAFFGSNGSIVNDNGLTINNANFGFRVPDIIANLRLDQAWGFVGISAALHDASAAYYATPNVVNNGHPEDRYGWAMAGGAKFNLPGGDMVGFNVCYSEGAAGMCTNQQTFQVYNNSNSVGLAWIADGVFNTGTQIELTRVWSALAAYEHIWNPKWRTAVGRRLRQRRLQRDRDQPHQRAAPRCRPGELRCGGSRCSDRRLHSGGRQQLQPGLQLLGSLYPHPVEPGAAARYRSASDVSRTQHRLQRRRRRWRRTARVPPSSTGSSTTRTSGPRCSAGSATSIHDRLSDPGKLQAPGGQNRRGFCFWHTGEPAS